MPSLSLSLSLSLYKFSRLQLDEAVWCRTPRGAIALAVVLDQLSRHFLRGQAGCEERCCEVFDPAPDLVAGIFRVERLRWLFDGRRHRAVRA